MARNYKGPHNIPAPQQTFTILRELRAIRIAKGITQFDASIALGYHRSQVRDLECYPHYILQRLTDYADYLGYEITLTPKSKP